MLLVYHSLANFAIFTMGKKMMKIGTGVMGTQVIHPKVAHHGSQLLTTTKIIQQKICKNRGQAKYSDTNVGSFCGKISNDIK